MKMKAVIYEGFAPESHLKMAEIDRPVPGDGEVLIRVAYAGVNPVDWKLQKGNVKGWLPYQLPIIPGWEASGTIAELGPGVSSFSVGDEVYTYARKPTVQWGTYAEYLAVPAAHVARRPKSVGLREAGGVPLTGLTSWQALRDHGQIKPGETVLVQGGAGGAGGYGIQYAKIAGAKVVATTSAGNAAYVKKLGADVIVDYRSEDVVEAIKRQFPDGIDVVYDTVGGETQAGSYAVLKKGGRLATIVGAPDPAKAGRPDVKASGMLVAPSGDDLAALSRLFDSGKLQVPETAEMPLAEAEAAWQKSAGGHTRGKIVLRVG